MRPQKYPVVLSEQEDEQLAIVVKHEGHSRRERERAQMLLWSASGKPDVEIAGLLGINVLTVATTRERWATEKRIADAPKPDRKNKLEYKKEAFMFALSCSDALDER